MSGIWIVFLCHLIDAASGAIAGFLGEFLRTVDEATGSFELGVLAYGLDVVEAAEGVAGGVDTDFGHGHRAIEDVGVFGN